MAQKVYILPTAMKCLACKEVSGELFRGFVEYGVGRCPRCGALTIEADLGARMKRAPKTN
ncbi:MAG TPA: hypothetical protein G4O03_05515 [Dehalococcoidia bacterium]|jgi:Zn finger protein HypA/HybF involved in hydrogenase expression|nr:hypothetical protein [Dehalococcoidia bacterium]